MSAINEDPEPELPLHPAPLRRRLRMFSALGHRDFRLLWAGALISTTGTWMQTVAQAWLVLSMTKSAFLLGVDGFLATLPMIFFSLLGGVFADRFDRRRMLLASQFAQMTLAFTLATLIYLDVVQVWHIFVLSFMTGSAQSLGGPAYQALLPQLVKREDVPNAIAMNSIQFNLARVFGPVLAGLSLAAFGAAVCFLLNGLSFIAVIFSLFFIRSRLVPEQKERQGVIEEMKEGLRFMKHKPALTQLSVFAFVSAFFGIPIVTMLPVVAQDTLALDARGYSWILTAYGAGSVLGALLLAAAGNRPRKGRLAIGFLSCFAVFLFIFSFSRSLPLSLVSIFFAGTSLIFVIAMVSSLVQLASSENMRGRVMSMFMLAFRGGMPLGNLTAGFVAQRFSVTAALATNAVILAVYALSFLVRPTAIREL